MSSSNLPMIIPSKRAWNHGRIIVQKRPLQPKHIWSISMQFEIAGTIRDLALFNMAIDSKLRGCDLVKLKVANICASGRRCHINFSKSKYRCTLKMRLVRFQQLTIF